MADRRIIYLTSWRASVYSAARGFLSVGPTFANDDEGHEAFAEFLRTLRPNTLLHVLSDVVEEDFHQDTIPYVRGKDRLQLIARRLAQRYRDTSLTLSLSLGLEKTQRKDERLLLSSFTNTQLFQPWLNALRQSELPVVGIYSVAFLASPLTKRLGFGTKAPALLVSLQPAGLRQTLVQNGKMRFSRLGPLDPAEAEQPARVAAAFAGETVRIHEYLTAVRVLPREGPALDVIHLAPPGRRDLLAAAVSDSPQLRYHVIDIADAASRIGLRDLPPDVGAEAVYAYLLAVDTPKEQYANESLRHHYRVWQGRMMMLAGGGAIFGACALMSAYQWLNVYEVTRKVEEEQLRARAVSEDFSRVTSGFPQIPTSADNLKLIVQQYGQLVKQTRYPEDLLRELSAALDASPQVALESLRWEGQASTPAVTRGTASARTVATAPGPKPAPSASQYEVIELRGRLPRIPPSDYRALVNAAEAFVAQIRKRPGIQVFSTKLPFDIGSENALSGELGELKGDDVPSFQVVFGRRTGP